MGQKVHPKGIRLGIIRAWDSNWYADRKSFAANLARDHKIRSFIKGTLGAQGAISRVVIEQHKGLRVSILTARPGVIIGKKGEDIEKLRLALTKLSGEPIQVNITEIRKPELDATLVAESIASQLERRIMFRRAMRRSVQSAIRLGASGIKVEVSGRLNGAEIARREWQREGRVPLHTFRADIDYGVAQAHTTYGVIGVKVWICKGEILGGMRAVLSGEKSTGSLSGKPDAIPAGTPKRAPRYGKARSARENQDATT